MKQKGCDIWFKSWIDKKEMLLYKMRQYFPKPYERFSTNVRVKSDLSNYVRNSNFKRETSATHSLTHSLTSYIKLINDLSTEIKLILIKELIKDLVNGYIFLLMQNITEYDSQNHFCFNHYTGNLKHYVMAILFQDVNLKHFPIILRNLQQH